MSPLNKSERNPLICYVTDRRSLLEADPARCHETLLSKIEEAAKGGVDWIQIREKDLSGKESSQLSFEALRCAASSPREDGSCARIMVNDRLDIALAAQVGGVHLGEQSLPPGEARRLCEALRRERDFLIGVSCHSLETAKAAEQSGADYLFFGPVFATPSKALYGAPQGLERLGEVCSAVSIPVLAIGGVTLENFPSCISAGASGIAAIRLFQDASDMTAVVHALRKIAGQPDA